MVFVENFIVHCESDCIRAGLVDDYDKDDSVQTHKRGSDTLNSDDTIWYKCNV